jgi:hypothetical protein
VYRRLQDMQRFFGEKGTCCCATFDAIQVGGSKAASVCVPGRQDEAIAPLPQFNQAKAHPPGSWDLSGVNAGPFTRVIADWSAALATSIDTLVLGYGVHGERPQTKTTKTRSSEK